MTKTLREGEDSMAPTHSPTAPANESHSQEAQHSPLPWKYLREDCDVVIRSADDMWIAAMQRFALMVSDDGTRNAAFIVRACNHHEALLDALKEAVEEVGRFGHGSIAIHLRKVIANAEEK